MIHSCEYLERYLGYDVTVVPVDATDAVESPTVADNMAATLSTWTKLAYGTGQLAEGVKNTAFSVFLLFYYNQVLGLPGIWTGVALGLATVIDAIIDPFMGSITDSFRHRWGRRLLFMYVAVVPLAVSFALLFFPPAGLGHAALFTWLLVCTVGVRAAMTLYAVPHMALGAELSSDYTERTAIVAYRNVFGFVGGVLVVAVGWGYFFRARRDLPGQLNGAVSALRYLLRHRRRRQRAGHRPRRTPAHPFLMQPRQHARAVGKRSSNGCARRSRNVVPRVVRRHRAAVRHAPASTETSASSSHPLLDDLAGRILTGPPRLGGLFVSTILWVLLSRRVDKRPAFLVGVTVFSIFSLLPPLGSCGCSRITRRGVRPAPRRWRSSRRWAPP